MLDFSKTILFTIPIYLCSEVQYNREIELAQKRAENEPVLSGRKAEIIWPPWRFNNIVGYLTVHYDGYFVVFRHLLFSDRYERRGEGRRLRKPQRDPFTRKANRIYLDGNWKFEKTVIKRTSNKELRICLIELLIDAKKELPRKDWFVDLEYYKNLINCLNIKRYLSQM